MTQKKQRNSFNSITLFPNKKTHALKAAVDKSDIGNDSEEVDEGDIENDSEPEEHQHFSESNISTYNRFQVLDKLSEDSSDQTFENAEKFEMPPVADSLDNLDSRNKPKERQVIDEINIEQLKTFLSEQLQRQVV